MKRIYAFLTILLAMMSIESMNGITRNGIWYSVDSDSTASVNGAASSLPDVIIQDTICDDGRVYKVTKIGYDAFRGKTTLHSIVINNTITTIESRTFEGCTNLSSVSMGDKVTSIGLDAFKGCTSLSSVVLGPNVQSITGFQGCTLLTSIILPNRLKTIGDAFKGCTALTSIVIPDSVEYVSSGAFNGCTALTSVTIGENVRELSSSYSSGEFYGCTNIQSVIWKAKRCTTCSDYCSPHATSLFAGSSSTLTSFTFGENVEYIPSYVCANLENLTSVVIPNSVKEIDEYAFLNCTNLENIVHSENLEKIAGYNRYDWPFAGTKWNENLLDGPVYIGKTICGYKGDEPSHLYIKDGTTSVADLAFRSSYIDTITIPNSLRFIGRQAFEYADVAVIRMQVDNQLEFIGDGAFIESTLWWKHANGPVYIGNILYGYKGKVPTDNTSIVVKEGTITIGESAIPKEVTSVVLPNSLKNIDKYAFKGCSNIVSITLPDNVTYIAQSAFKGCSNLTSITLGNKVQSIGMYAFQECKKLNAIRIPGSVSAIEDEAFIDCAALTSVIIEEGVTKIGESAFESCKSLTDIVIPNSVTEVGKYAFRSCSGLETLVIGDGVVSVGELAFRSCTNLRYVSVGKSVTNLPQFDNCGKIKEVVWNARRYEGECRAFNDYCYLTSVTFGPEVECIPDKLCYCPPMNTRLQGLTSIIIPNSVKRIGKNAFSGCLGLTSIVLPKDVEYIGGGAFYYCVNLTSVVLPEGLKRIGTYAFAYCRNLSEIGIPQSVAHIDKKAFMHCIKLPSVSIAKAEIGANAFSECEELQSVLIGKDVSYIHPHAFTNTGTTELSIVVDGDNPVYDSRDNCNAIIKTSTNTLRSGCCNSIIPKSVDNIGQYAFYECKNLPNIVFHKDVKNLDINSFGDVFQSTANTAYVICYAEIPPVADYAWLQSNTDVRLSTIPLYVPSSSISAYKAAKGWKNFKIKSIENAPTEVENTFVQGVQILEGRVICRDLYKIYDLQGRDVTTMNGNLQGLYIVKTLTAVQKVFVQ